MANRRSRLMNFGPLLGALAIAQAAAAQTDCAAALKYAGESWEQRSDSEQVSSAVDFFCSQEFDSSQDAVDTAGKAGFPIEGIPIDFSGKLSASQFKVRQRQFCSSQTRYSDAKTSYHAIMKKLNSSVANAVADCIRNQATGFFAWIEETNATVFRVELNLRNLTVPADVTLLAFKPSSIAATCTGLPVTSVHLAYEIQCSRDPDQTVDVTLNLANYKPQWIGPQSLPARFVFPPVPPCKKASGQLFVGNAQVGLGDCPHVTKSDTIALDFGSQKDRCAIADIRFFVTRVPGYPGCANSRESFQLGTDAIDKDRYTFGVAEPKIDINCRYSVGATWHFDDGGEGSNSFGADFVK